jgi:hypothetical protein
MIPLLTVRNGMIDYYKGGILTCAYNTWCHKLLPQILGRAHVQNMVPVKSRLLKWVSGREDYMSIPPSGG